MALAWAAWLASAAGFIVWRLPAVSMETSIFALLPDQAPDPVAHRAAAALRSGLENRFLVLFVHPDLEKSIEAAEAYAARLRLSGQAQEIVCAIQTDPVSRMLDFYGPHRFGLLSPEDRKALEMNPVALFDAAQRTLYLPPGLSGSLGFGLDPFGTWGRWLSGRSGFGSAFQIRNEHLTVSMGPSTAAAVMGNLDSRRRDQEERKSLSEAFAASDSAAKKIPGVEIFHSGFVFHELKAAGQAHQEMTSIGTVSAILLLILMLAAFRKLLPTLLGFLPVAVGCLSASAVLILIDGGKIHLITMVFGATIVGVAEDYGILYIVGIYADSIWDSRQRLRDVQTSLLLGLITSVLGYVALFFVPVPGLRQIGIFSITGLTAAWMTVVLWYPFLGKNLRRTDSRARSVAESVERGWPKLGKPGVSWLLGGIFAISLAGISKLTVNDDVRLLYAQDSGLQREQDTVSSVIQSPGSARYFLIRGRNGQEILEHEEKLREALAAADPGGSKAMGVSVFVPSRSRQARDSELLRSALNGSAKVGDSLSVELKTPELGTRLGESLQEHSLPLFLDKWLASPVSLPFRHLWGNGSAGEEFSVLLIPNPVRIPNSKLKALAMEAGPGIALIDQIGEITNSLGMIRHNLALVLGIGGFLIVLGLFVILRKKAWRAIAPAFLGLTAGLGGLGWSHQPLNIFGLLALALILGMGVDYGIFVQESRRNKMASALMGINLGASTSLVAFGMLVFSTTPALKTFGLVLVMGLGTAWLTAPCFAARDEKGNPHEL